MTPEQKQKLRDRIDALIVRAISFYLAECEEYESDNPFKFKAPIEPISQLKILKAQLEDL